MNTISLTYPESWLTVNVSVYVKWSATLDNSGVATETWTTKTYIYEFTWATNTDYVYVATVAWYQDIGWTVFSNNWIVNDVWEAQISDYSSNIGTFWHKFAQYGGVSHVVHEKGWATLTIEEKELIKKNKETMDKVLSKLDKWITKEEISSLLSQIKPIDKPQDNSLIVKLFTELKDWIKTLVNNSEAHKKLMEKKDKEEVKEDRADDAEIITWVIDDNHKELVNKFDTIIDMMEGYEGIISVLEKDIENYKKIIWQLTNK